MNYTNLGSSEIKISKIGLGTLFNNKRKDIKKLSKIISRSYELGINFIDTAAIYNQGKTEALIGETIKKEREKFIIATKNLPSQNSYNDILNSADKSLKRLKTDYIDLYQIHWPNHKINIEQTAEALDHLVKTGKIRKIGICNMNLTETELYLKHLKKNLVSIQNEYNLIQTFEDGYIKKLVKNNNTTFIAYSPFFNGRIFGNTKQKKIISGLSKKYNKSVSDIVLNWITNKSKNFIAIPATLKIKNLINNSNSQNFKMDDKDLSMISDKCDLKTNNLKVKEIDFNNQNISSNILYAKMNKNNFYPSPLELSQHLKNTKILKPIKVMKFKNREKKIKYQLIEGNLRYLSWILAYGENSKIPCLICENI